MKTNYLRLFLAGVLLSLTIACQKDVSLDPIGFEPTTFTTEAQLSNQLAGVYNVLEMDQLYAQGLWGYLQAGADESFRNGTNASTILTELYSISNSEANVNTFWKQLYIGIERANVLLDGINKVTMDETKRANIRGQALFLRAYYFYLLVSNFGDVPLKTTLTTDMGTNFNLPRTPAKDVYALILRDMTKADSLVQTMPQAQTPTIVTQTAVEAILARVCLTMAGEPLKDVSKYKDALFWAQKVISSNLHSLNSTPLPQSAGTPAYARLFINNMQNNVNDKNTSEGIWDAAFLSKSNATGTYASSGFLVTQTLGAIMGVTCPDASASAPIGFSPGTYRAQASLYKLYGPGDLRRDWAIAPYIYKDATTTRYPILSVNITGGGGTGAAAIANVSPTGAITSITVENGGSGYSTAPTVSFSATAGSGAVATAVVTGGKLTAITLATPGTGYPSLYDRPVGKWRREYELNLPPVRLQNNTSSNFPIIRYADVLLMAAEADLKVNGGAKGVDYYNQVRRRAYGLNPLVSGSPVDATAITMQDIMDERSRELCFEGQRRNDLIRWGVMQNVMQNLIATVSSTAPSNYVTSASLAATNFVTAYPKHLLFPIPANEISLDNALTQNPGW
ncbi:RagB/SusD family nutrient uptake outer membrane protein (plasmid) [Spirosoma sp. SC4-14]|uniref:RagB/SusD family nutrient uptake outer membrane protein n=1 Tax=Spirosoma sp. SC4-14 TaxID=3128900 RepID=UPI0030D1049C